MTLTGDVGITMDGWVMNGNTGGLDLCSTDCQKEQDACYTKAYAECEPQPQFGCEPPGLKEAYERLHYEALKVRGLSQRITRAKLL